MKTIRPGVVVLIILLIGCFAAAQTKQKKGQPQSVAGSATSASQHDMDHEMQNASPGATHSRLAKMAGDYSTTTKFYMAPNTPPQESAGEARLWMSLDGRFLSEEDTGTFMGQPLKSFRMLGYNNASKRYEGIWTYTMSTGIMTLSGISADGGNTVNLAATFDGEGGVKEKLNVLMRRVDEDRFVVDLISTQPDGKPGPRLETTYIRKK